MRNYIIWRNEIEIVECHGVGFPPICPNPCRGAFGNGLRLPTNDDVVQRFLLPAPPRHSLCVILLLFCGTEKANCTKNSIFHFVASVASYFIIILIPAAQAVVGKGFE